MRALIFVLAIIAAPIAAHAQESHQVKFGAGKSGTTIHGTIKGNAFVDYQLDASAGQVMTASLAPATIYFNVLPPPVGEAATLFTGSVQGPNFRGSLPSAGTYTVRIYQMGAAKDEEKARDFTLAIGIH